MNSKPKFSQDDRTPLNTGQMLSEYIKKKRIRVMPLARLMNRNIQNIIDYRKNKSIQTNILYEICAGLKYNFFAEIANQMPEEWALPEPTSRVAAMQERIEMLETENRELRIERDLLLKVAMK